MTTQKGLIIVPVPCRVRIRKDHPIDPISLFYKRTRGSKMWVGYCTCGKTWQFWFFGATLGYGLEHMRREQYKK